jgi:hypothetical protein
LKDRFCEFPDGAVASLFSQNSMRSLPHRLAGIGWSDQKFNNGPHGKVIEVVADKGRFGNVDPELFLELKQRLRFVFDAHETVLNSQLACPHLSGAPLPATEEGDFDSCLLKQTNPKTVPHIKPFG